MACDYCAYRYSYDCDDGWNRHKNCESFKLDWDTCQFCNTDYADKEKAMQCEKNHKVLETATIIGDYKSLKSIPDGCPTKVKVKFKGSDKWIEYKR